LSVEQAVEPKTVQIPMRDGALLAGDLYLPGPGRHPTLIRKTPYDRRRDAIVPEIEAFAAHGYAVLVVSFRGRFGSQGNYNAWRSEGWQELQDGYDTIEWAAEQPWSTGAVGTWGVSADGECQLNTAPTKPPHLKAMVVSYAANARVGLMDGGALTHTGPLWHEKNGAFSLPLRTREDWDRWLAQWRDTGMPLMVSFVHTALLEPLLNAETDAYWRDFDPASRYDDFDVPVLYECGWYDRYTRTQFNHFAGVREQAPEAARAGQRLICGPWVHGGNLAPETDNVTFAEEAVIDRIALHLRWFDHWLKDEDNGVAEEPAMRLYMLGADEWIDVPVWPPAEPPVPYFLRAGDGAAEGSLNGGVLSTEPPADEAPDAYVHDPHDPVPTIGGHGGTGWIWAAGPLDQRPAEERCLTFTTEPSAGELRIVGVPVVVLHAASSAVDTDFVATISRVHADGYSELVEQKAVRARYRNGYGNPTFLEPGAVEELEIVLGPVALRIAPGECLRLTIASSCFPAFIPNAGTAEPVHLASAAVKATNTIHHDRVRPSHVLLPLQGTDAS